jgi:hypothetical protein
MLGELSESILAPSTLLWLAGAGTAGVILFGSINRRRSRLTEALRDYVDQNQEGRQSLPTSDEDGLSD